MSVDRGCHPKRYRDTRWEGKVSILHAPSSDDLAVLGLLGLLYPPEPIPQMATLSPERGKGWPEITIRVKGEVRMRLRSESKDHACSWPSCGVASLANQQLLSLTGP